MKTLTVTCTCCQAELRIDSETGLVLKSREKKSDYSLDSALQKEAQRKSEADRLFADAFQKEQDRFASLEDKFRKALESKDELDEPTRPWDFD